MAKGMFKRGKLGLGLKPKRMKGVGWNKKPTGAGKGAGQALYRELIRVGSKCVATLIHYI